MHELDLTLPQPEENLALDEALLDWAEQDSSRQILRFWESPTPFVVLGYGNRAGTETLPQTCQADHIPILRRCSGGGTVLQGPGCLNYSLILQFKTNPNLETVSAANGFIMSRNRQALAPLLAPARVQIQGHTDLTLDGRKFSGNAQRRKRSALLFHGSILLDAFDLKQIHRHLSMPSREPDYRRSRSHQDFLTTIPLTRAQIQAALRQAWHAATPLDSWPEPALRHLVLTRYANPEWVNR